MATVRSTAAVLTLHEAARAQEHLARFLTARGEPLDARDAAGATPLHHALRAVLGSVVLPTPAYTLLALGAAADLAEPDGTRPLHLACSGGKADAVWLLRACGADPTRPDLAGRRPEDLIPDAARAVVLPLLGDLATASVDAARAVVLPLLGDLASGSAVDPPRAGDLAAASARNAQLLRDPAPRAGDLAAASAARNAELRRDPRAGDLATASAARDAQLLRDPHRAGDLVAAAAGDAALAAALLRAGADPTTRDAEGRTALHTCSSDAILVALLALGAEVDATDARGETPLHVACRSLGRAIPLLLLAGADPDRRDASGKLPADNLRAQVYEPDFYDGDRLEGLRQRHLAALEAAKVSRAAE